MQGRLYANGILEHAQCYQHWQDAESIAPGLIMRRRSVPDMRDRST